MNKLTKVSALLLPSASTLAACGQDKKKKQRSLRRKPYYSGNRSGDNDYTSNNDCSAQTTVAKSDAKDGEVAFERINGNNITKVKITFKDGLIQK